ncbi:MAG: FliH/SctL family protein [Planctomycetota bacterium]
MESREHNSVIAIPHSTAFAEAGRTNRSPQSSQPVLISSRPTVNARRSTAPTELPPSEVSLEPSKGPNLQQVIRRLQQLDAKFQELTRARSNDLASMRRMAVQLAVEIASTIVVRELDSNGVDLGNQISAALQDLEYDMAIVRMNPQDANSTQREFLHIEILEDEAVEPGNCIIETEDVTLERNWREQLDRIRNNLLNGLDNAGS